MNWVDLIIILAVFAFAIEGQKRGFVVQAVDIFGFLASLVGSLMLYQSVASVLVKVFSLPQIAALPIAFLLVWIVVESVFFIIFALLMAALARLPFTELIFSVLFLSGIWLLNGDKK